MHVGRGCSHIAQARRAEAPHVFGLAGDGHQSRVVRGVSALAVDVVEAVVVKAGLGLFKPFVHDRIAEGDAAVAVEAGQAFAEKKRFAALRRGAYSPGVATEAVPVVRGIKGYERALERRQGAREVGNPPGDCVVGERLLEHSFVARVAPQQALDIRLAARQAHFHRMLAEHRHQCLGLEARLVRVGPGKRRKVRDIAQSHGVARVGNAGGAYGQLAPVAECLRLDVATRARHAAGDGKAAVVEQMPAQFYLGYRHRIVGRHHRPGHPRRQAPFPIDRAGVAGKYQQAGKQRSAARQAHRASACGLRAGPSWRRRPPADARWP